MAGKTTVWGIHANPNVDAQDAFRRLGMIAIGWPALGDLSRIKGSRSAFKAALKQACPDKKAGALPVQAGVMYRFVHEMQPGDHVVYPSKRDRQINIGVIDGPYVHNPEFDPDNPNIRRVRWQRTIPRSHFSQGALHEIGSALSLFQVKNFDSEFLNALRGEDSNVPIEADESTVGSLVDQIEETTRDYIVKILSTHIKGHALAHLVGHLLTCMGYRARVSPPGPDQGVDILAHTDALGFQPPIIKVQVKSGEGTIGRPNVSSFYGTVEQNEYGLFVTMGTYSTDAKHFERSKTNLRLIDGNELIGLILEYYEHFDMTFKTAIPLKRVYVPSRASDTVG